MKMNELAQTGPVAPSVVTEFVECILQGFAGNGAPLITLGVGDGEVLSALASLPLGIEHVGRRMVAIRLRDRREPPIVLGLLRSSDQPEANRRSVTLEADGEKVTLRAAKQLVLACGESSITLTSTGDVLIRGKHVVSYSSGQNKIKGASIHLN